jgi:hypothetical protein
MPPVLWILVLVSLSANPAMSEDNKFSIRSFQHPIIMEGSLGLRGLSVGLGGKTADGVVICGLVVLSYDIGKYPSDEPSPGGDWYWLSPTEEYDVTTGALGIECGFPIGRRIPMQAVFGAGIYHSAHVERLVSSATGWDWYRTSEDKLDLWYEVGARYLFDWSPGVPGFVTVLHDPVQTFAIELGTTLWF